MNIVALIAGLSLNYSATKDRQTKTPLAPAVIIALNGYYLLLLPFPKALKACLTRLGEIPLAVHALPQAVPPAKHSSPGWEV